MIDELIMKSLTLFSHVSYLYLDTSALVKTRGHGLGLTHDFLSRVNGKVYYWSFLC